MEYVLKRKEDAMKKVADYGIIAMAAAGYGAAVSLLIEPAHLAPGGVTGVAILLGHMLRMETGDLVLLLNLPIMGIGIRKFGLRFMCSTFYGLFLSAVFIRVFSCFPPLTGDVLLAALAGGALTACCIGIIFRKGATTGGMDIIIRCLRLKYPHIRTGALYFMTDGVIAAASAFVFGNIDLALYGVISITVTSMVLDLVLYGKEGDGLLYIISDCPEGIRIRLLEELQVGVTFLKGQGGYRGDHKEVILCVVHKQLISKVEEIVRTEDAEAFMIIARASEIFGKGYKSYSGDRI